jgi:hypothetical protein
MFSSDGIKIREKHKFCESVQTGKMYVKAWDFSPNATPFQRE